MLSKRGSDCSLGNNDRFGFIIRCKFTELSVRKLLSGWALRRRNDVHESSIQPREINSIGHATTEVSEDHAAEVT